MAPDQFGVAQPLGMEDLDKHVTRHDIYPSFPAPAGVPQSEYIRSQRNRSRSVSSSTEALDSDHARYITSKITQHARSMATGTRSLPTDSPVPYFQPLERGHMSEDVPSDMGSPEGALHERVQMPPCHANLDVFPYMSSGGIEYNPEIFEQERLSTYTGLDDYDTLFEARHSRGAVDNKPKSCERTAHISSMGMPPMIASEDMTENLMVGARPKHTPNSGHLPPDQRECVSVGKVPSTTGQRIVSPVNTQHILKEGAAIFTDMTETVLTALDQQMALSGEAQKPEGSLTSNVLTPRQLPGSSDSGKPKTIPQTVYKIENKHPDLYLPVAKNYTISDRFYGYMDSISADINPMILVELTGLSYRYGTAIYVVDRVNGTMYDKFSVGYRVINERATVEPQFRDASLESEYVPMQPTYANTLQGATSMVTPVAKSTPITQSLHMPKISATLPHVRDILAPASSEQVRPAYLERQMRQMGSVKLPSGMPSLEDGMVSRLESLQDRIHNFC